MAVGSDFESARMERVGWGPDGSTSQMTGSGLSKRSGAGEGTRTPDPIITNDVLYQLSYTGTSLRALCPSS